MWLQDIKGFCRRHNIAPDQALKLKCTAEHLIARKDGGPDTDENIVAACDFCNQARHLSEDAKSADEFLIFAREELAANRWHGLQLRSA